MTLLTISIESLGRGLLGLAVILALAWLFSSDRKAIQWKVVGIGIGAQLLLALAILKVSFVQSFFEFCGKVFVKILDFTRDGSVFLFGDMLKVDSFGFIFAFQVLPTIIFFSAQTNKQP